jgi:type IV fimbrial biogenesis protein FimT
MKQHRRSGSSGYTAIELVVVLLVTAIMATLALPSFIAMIRNTRLDTYSELLRADLLIARREAIKMNGRVLVCPAGSSANTCGTDYSKWANGWIVCYDLNADGACDASTAAAPNPILARGAIDPSMVLSGPSAAVRFNSNGTQGAVGAPSVAFTVSGHWSGATSLAPTIAASGNIVLAKGS